MQEGTQFDPATDGLETVFYLAYQGLHDRDIQEMISRLFRPHEAGANEFGARSDGNSDVVRIGFISRFFRNHTIGKLARGFVSQLSRQSFTVTVLSLGIHTDADAQWIKEHADNYSAIPFHLQRAAETIADQKLDILVYPDIGMDPITLSLARLRLAPVQCVMWGHPVTTGIPTVDYFISSELLEPADGDEHYTERLVRLKTLPTYYYRPRLRAELKGRSDFGLADDLHIYLCPQNLFKFHPDFDHPMAEILRRDPNGQVVLIEGLHPHWTELLLRRYGCTIPDVLDRIKFVSRQGYHDFLDLVAVSDVLLDPFHFGGGNTTYEAIGIGVPIATLPSAYMRGRLTYACYKKMGVLDCVASDPQEYVDIAVRLGTDRAYRETIRAKIASTSDVLFEDIETVRELEQFFQRAIQERREQSRTNN